MADIYRLESGKIYRKELKEGGAVEEVCIRPGEEFIPSPEEFEGNKFRLVKVSTAAPTDPRLASIELNSNKAAKAAYTAAATPAVLSENDTYRLISECKDINELLKLQAQEAARPSPRKRVLQAIKANIDKLKEAAQASMT